MILSTADESLTHVELTPRAPLTGCSVEPLPTSRKTIDSRDCDISGAHRRFIHQVVGQVSSMDPASVATITSRQRHIYHASEPPEGSSYNRLFGYFLLFRSKIFLFPTLSLLMPSWAVCSDFIENWPNWGI